ncbi:MAG: iron-containing alcohol dehydrogenase [Candidatus Dormibacteria bacterium]
MAYDESLNFIFHSPTRIVFGAGSVREILTEASELGGSRAIVITDQGLAGSAPVAAVEKALGKKHALTYTDVVPDSGVELVEEAAGLARSHGCDLVVSVGGGSSIDTAKMVATLLAHGGRLLDWEGTHTLPGRAVPHIAVPTTAGTGSEVTNVALVKDRAATVKRFFIDHHLCPDLALLDPELTVGLPAMITAGTGADALSHAIESMHSVFHEPLTDGLAMHAIRLIRDNLVTATREPSNLVARGQMLVAATSAALAFGNALVGLVHAMSHTIGARHGVHHGTANGILMAPVMRFNHDYCQDRYALVAEALGVRVEGMSEEAAADAAADAVDRLLRATGMPMRLREVGVPNEALEEDSELSMNDGSILYNPRPITDPEEVLTVFQEAW